MPVHALIATVRTRPEPAVFPVLDRFDEEFADFVGSGFGVAVFTQDYLSQFLLIPLRHVISLLILLPFLPFPRIRIQIPLLALPPHLQIMTELALLPLLTATLLEKLTQHGFGVDAEGHFLHLDGLE